MHLNSLARAWRPSVPVISATSRTLFRGDAPAPPSSEEILKARIPPIANAMLQGIGNVLCIAPRSQTWLAGAPANVTFLPQAIPRDELMRSIQRFQPSAIVVGDQAVDNELSAAWKAACPGQQLVLIRRGTSLDKIDRRACEDHGIQLANTHGVNATHVASYAATQLRDAQGRINADIRLLGYGAVGSELVRLLRTEAPPLKVTVLVREGRSRAGTGPEQRDNCVFIDSWEQAFDDASAVVIAVATNRETVGRIDQHHINRMNGPGRIVCVSKPDVFSDEALVALADRRDIELVVDYGPATLEAFQQRLQSLGVPQERWGSALRLTSLAATGDECKFDLDYAVAMRLATVAVDQMVARKLGDSFAIPAHPPSFDAPAAAVVGRGINGLFQTLLLRLAGYKVCVYGDDNEAAGASHKNINMRHLSATETTAKPLHNPFLLPINSEFIVALNRGGMELFRKFLQDNPTLRQLVQDDVVRAFPEGEPDHGMSLQQDISLRDWPGGRKGEGYSDIGVEEFQRSFGVPGIARAIRLPGYDLEFRKLMQTLPRMLEKAGVTFVEGRLDAEQIVEMGRCDRPVVAAMGVAGEGVIPIVGWFVRLRAVGSEGRGIRGLKLQYDLPIGVMNCRLDGDHLLISGGQVPFGSSETEKQAIQGKVLGAISRHFPRSYAQAVASDGLEVLACARPGAKDGLPRIERQGNLLSCGATYAGGTTQGLLLASVVQSMIQNRGPAFGTEKL
ncbi:hypothetical protein GCM10023165_11900 [Variovorax defluvii]|uniref:Amino acid dehydrogenase n=1 Tax=Variovorax defluvii TaxID=913761 RepID=A0ABP8H822_9BURK